jgi:hypothetical protein
LPAFDCRQTIESTLGDLFVNPQGRPNHPERASQIRKMPNYNRNFPWFLLARVR